MAVKSYTELLVWQRAMDLVEAVYRLTRGFPAEERYGLTTQLRRAAVSIPSNIAEGQGRDTTRDFLHFLAVARGSLFEVETQVLLTERLGLTSAAELQDVFDRTGEIGRMLAGLTRSLHSRDSSSAH